MVVEVLLKHTMRNNASLRVLLKNPNVIRGQLTTLKIPTSIA